MKFSVFIEGHLDQIVAEWERFARTILPAAEGMSGLALRDHCRAMLVAIAKEMETSQTDAARAAKSKGVARVGTSAETAAAVHGSFRETSGFTLVQLFAEFRALRASVLALWRCAEGTTDREIAIEEIARFNEAVDQAVADSIDRYEQHFLVHSHESGFIDRVGNQSAGA